MLILFISLNSIFSVEYDFNLKVGEVKNESRYEIALKNLNVSSEKNYKKITGDVIVSNNQKNISEFLKPEIRIYNKPETITYEASIKSRVFSDIYVTMSNLSESDFYNIKLQNKPFMNLIWISVIIISLGGFLRIIVGRKKI